MRKCSFSRILTIHDAISILEEDDNFTEADITLLPPENANGNITNEDSGDEDDFILSNLPASQLRAPAEMNFTSGNTCAYFVNIM